MSKKNLNKSKRVIRSHKFASEYYLLSYYCVLLCMKKIEVKKHLKNAEFQKICNPIFSVCASVSSRYDILFLLV